MANLNTYLHEVTRACTITSGTAPAQRKLFRQGYSFSQLPVEEQAPVWDYIWNHGGNFWVMVQAFFWCESLMKKEKELVQLWPAIKQWQQRVDSWALSDCLSKIYARVLEINSTLVYPVLAEWNRSPDPWKRRQSVVALLYYSSTRKKILPFKKMIVHVQRLLGDKDYYVQKGVGWILRELYNVYPAETMQFITKHVKQLSSTAFATATEKLNKDQKQELKALR